MFPVQLSRKKKCKYNLYHPVISITEIYNYNLNCLCCLCIAIIKCNLFCADKTNDNMRYEA